MPSASSGATVRAAASARSADGAVRRVRRGGRVAVRAAVSGVGLVGAGARSVRGGDRQLERDARADGRVRERRAHAERRGAPERAPVLCGG